MSSEENRQIASRLPMEFSKGNVGVLDEVASPTAVDHAVPPGMPPTIEGTKMFMTALFGAFPDLTYRVEREVADGDLVAQHVSVTGTMTGAFMGMPATGRQATWSEMHIVRMEDGKVVEHWANVDQMGMMTQLGLIPTSDRR